MTTLENLTNKYSYQYEGKKTILIAGWAWQSNLLVISQKKTILAKFCIVFAVIAELILAKYERKF